MIKTNYVDNVLLLIGQYSFESNVSNLNLETIFSELLLKAEKYNFIEFISSSSSSHTFFSFRFKDPTYEKLRGTNYRFKVKVVRDSNSIKPSINLNLADYNLLSEQVFTDLVSSNSILSQEQISNLFVYGSITSNSFSLTAVDCKSRETIWSVGAISTANYKHVFMNNGVFRSKSNSLAPLICRKVSDNDSAETLKLYDDDYYEGFVAEDSNWILVSNEGDGIEVRDLLRNTSKDIFLNREIFYEDYNIWLVNFQPSESQLLASRLWTNSILF